MYAAPSSSYCEDYPSLVPLIPACPQGLPLQQLQYLRQVPSRKIRALPPGSLCRACRLHKWLAAAESCCAAVRAPLQIMWQQLVKLKMILLEEKIPPPSPKSICGAPPRKKITPCTWRWRCWRRCGKMQPAFQDSSQPRPLQVSCDSSFCISTS